MPIERTALTLNYIWWWDFSSGDLEGTSSLLLLPGSLFIRVVEPVKVSSMDQIDILKKYLNHVKKKKNS